MLKIGIIGLGNIAQKAYLPIFSQLEQIEWHLFTRNTEKLQQISNQYRFTHIYSSVDELLDSVQGVFIHSATDSHEEIIEKALLKGVHVYVDKPITYHYETSKRLTELAESKNLLLMTGFNRRYAPAHKQLALDNPSPNMVIMQKNRAHRPAPIREFILDDFIHVIDTVRYLFPYEIKNISISRKIENGLLHHIIVQLIASEGHAIAILNRDSGITQETVEVTTPNGKTTVQNLSETTIQQNKQQHYIGTEDWTTTLSKRGFESIILDFISCIRNNTQPMISMSDALETHKLCEEIIVQLEK